MEMGRERRKGRVPVSLMQIRLRVTRLTMTKMNLNQVRSIRKKSNSARLETMKERTRAATRVKLNHSKVHLLFLLIKRNRNQGQKVILIKMLTSYHLMKYPNLKIKEHKA